MPGLSKTKVMNVMGVHIASDGTIEEFVVPRNKINLHSFDPDGCLSGVCVFEKGEGKPTPLAQMEFQQSNILVFAWEKGDETKTNRYDYFPPPLDTDVLYGSIFIFRTNRRSGQVQSLTGDLFERYIETCHKGFEDLGSDDTDDDDDEDEYDDLPTREDIEFIDNRTLDEIEDDASLEEESDDESSADEEESEAEDDEVGEGEDDAEDDAEDDFE